MRLWRIFSDHRTSFAWPADREGFREQYDDYNLVTRPGMVDNWPGLELSFREGEPHAWADAITGVPRIDVYSSRLKQVLEDCLGEADRIQWLQASVAEPKTGESRPYWVVNPLVVPALNAARTTRGLAPSNFVKAVFDPELVGARRILKYPYGMEPVVVHEVREAVEAAGCTGLRFRPVPTASGTEDG